MLTRGSLRPIRKAPSLLPHLIPFYNSINNSYKQLHTTMPTHDLKDAKVTSIAPMTNSDARWIKLDKIKYIGPDNNPREWEMASRTTRPPGKDIDGVGIIAIVKNPETGAKEIVLQKQFRPPVEGICIEMPAGLLDANETLEQCALRELKEETGYIGTVISSSPLIFNDPGFCNTNTVIVTVEVDITDERNVNPVAELEENEFIETFTVPLDSFYESLFELHQQGYKLDARVQNVAEGMKLARLNL